MNALFRKSVLPLILLVSRAAPRRGKPPPSISLDEPVQAQPLPEPPAGGGHHRSRTLALPDQLKPLPGTDGAARAGAGRRNQCARQGQRRGAHCADPRGLRQRDSGGLLHRWRALSGLCRAGRVTVVSLQPGEELVTVAAGDTVRWIVGDTSSGSGDALRVNVLVKPIRSPENQSGHHHQPQDVPAGADLDRACMDGPVSWDYPKRPDAGLAAPGAASAAAPVNTGLSLEKIRFRYAISGSNLPWKRYAFDDGEKVHIQFPRRASPSELPRCSSSACRRRATGEHTVSARRTTSWIGCSARPNCALAAMVATWCGLSARMAWRGGTDHEPGRHP